MRTLDDYLADRIKLEPCRGCGKSGKNIWIVHAFPRVRYFCECQSCHYCGKTRITQVGACVAWNKNAKRMRKK